MINDVARLDNFLANFRSRRPIRLLISSQIYVSGILIWALTDHRDI